MRVGIALVLGSPCIPVVLSNARPLVECVVEALPLVARVSIITEFVVRMESLHFLAHLANADEVVADLAVHFTSINQPEELRLDSGVEVEFELWSGIGVDANVVELGVLSCQCFVVPLDLGTHRVPACCEVEQSVDWPFLVQMLHHVLNTIL